MPASHNQRFACHRLRSVADAIERGEWTDGYRLVADESELAFLEGIIKAALAEAKDTIVRRLRAAADGIEGSA